MQAPAKIEDALCELLRDAHAIVPKRQLPVIAIRLTADGDDRALAAAEFDGVRHEVLKQVHQLVLVADHNRKPTEPDLSLSLADGGAQVVHGLIEACIEVDWRQSRSSFRYG